MTDTFRTFIAVRIPINEQLRLILNQLRNIGRPVKAVEEDHLHVTLKFLGDVLRNGIDDVSGMLESVCSRHSAFHVTLRTLGAFPGVERPTVIWAGIDEVEPLVELAAEIEDACATLGYPKEQRPFHPHLTFARIRRMRRGNSSIPDGLHELLQEFQETGFGRVTVERIVFFRSQLLDHGPVYSELFSADLLS